MPGGMRVYGPNECQLPTLVTISFHFLGYYPSTSGLEEHWVGSYADLPVHDALLHPNPMLGWFPFQHLENPV